MALAAIAVPVTRAQPLVQTHQPVHAVTVNQMTEAALCVEPARMPANTAQQTQFPLVLPVMALAARAVHEYCLLVNALR